MVALALLTLAACSFTPKNNPITGGDVSIEREQEMTSEVAQQIRDNLPLVNDPVLLDYVNEIGQEIVGVTEPQPFLFRFALIEDEALNAFTIGGGYVYLNSGVLAQSSDVCEFVGVLAHEIAHVRLRHIVRRSEGQGLAMLANLVALAAVALAGADASALLLSQSLNVALQLKHSRAAESEADREAIAYMLRAGYDPDGLTRFFQHLVAAYPDPGEIPAYLYTHPAVKDRISASRVEIARVEGRGRGSTRDNPLTDELTPAPVTRVVPSERCDDPRLREMQARLVTLLEPVAGGSGLQARSEFDRELTDLLLADAAVEREAGRLEAADLLLHQAEEREPNDPRVAIARAELAEERGDWQSASQQYERAFQLDPWVPLVQYRLGISQQRLGHRTRAAFYLERAAASFRPGTAARKRSEFAIRALTVPVLKHSELSGGEGDPPRVRQGDTVAWSGSIHRRFLEDNPELSVQWRDPDGEIAAEESMRMNPLGQISTELDTANRPTGEWSVSISSGDVSVSELEFSLVPPDGPRD